MPQKHNSDRTFGHRIRLRAALGAAVAALVICANAPAARAGDDDDESLTTKFMRSLGFKDPRQMEYGINYSERSPLVVPPTRDLPPPATAAAAPVPNWPKDPDLRRRAAAKAKSKEIHVYNFMENSRPLRPDELDKGRGSNANDGKMASGDGENRQLSAGELAGKKSIFSLDWFKKEEYATFTGEPERANLTDPPPGYRTPSPDEPYGIGPDKTKAKPTNLGERMEAETGH